MKPDQERNRKRFFAVTSLGKDRWYWVVWPSLEAIRAGAAVGHVADGYEQSKGEAVDRALEIAGLHGEWVEAKYARSYQQRLNRQKGKEGGGEGGLFPAAMEFLYRDHQDPITGEWYSTPHRLIRKTEKYVYVEQEAYNPARLTGSWLDHRVPMFRLNRASLEQEGYAFIPFSEGPDDPLFFTSPYLERLAGHSREVPDCFELLELPFPCSVAEVKAAYRKLAKQLHPDQGGHHEAFLALQAAYEQALRLCRYK